MITAPALGDAAKGNGSVDIGRSTLRPVSTRHSARASEAARRGVSPGCRFGIGRAESLESLESSRFVSEQAAPSGATCRGTLWEGGLRRGILAVDCAAASLADALPGLWARACSISEAKGFVLALEIT